MLTDVKKDGVTSLTYIRALLRGTTIQLLLNADKANDNKIGLKLLAKDKEILLTSLNNLSSLHIIYHKYSDDNTIKYQVLAQEKEIYLT